MLVSKREGGSMASQLRRSHFITTYARKVISDWPELAGIMLHYSTFVKDQMGGAGSALKSAERVLTAGQIDEVLNGPYQSFAQMLMSGYALITRLNHAKIAINNDAFKQPEGLIDENDSQLPVELVKRITSAEIKTMTESLDALLKEFDQAWEEFYQRVEGMLLDKFAQMKLKLTEQDMIEFKNRYPASELLDRFVDLSLPVSDFDVKSINFSGYFYCKSALCVYSTLSVAHLANQPYDISAVLRPLAKFFSKVAQDDKAMLAKQTKQINELLQPLDFIKTEKE